MRWQNPVLITRAKPGPDYPSFTRIILRPKYPGNIRFSQNKVFYYPGTQFWTVLEVVADKLIAIVIVHTKSEKIKSRGNECHKDLIEFSGCQGYESRWVTTTRISSYELLTPVHYWIFFTYVFGRMRLFRRSWQLSRRSS